jgi:hypothetical protein
LAKDTLLLSPTLNYKDTMEGEERDSKLLHKRKPKWEDNRVTNYSCLPRIKGAHEMQQFSANALTVPGTQG